MIPASPARPMCWFSNKSHGRASALRTADDFLRAMDGPGDIDASSPQHQASGPRTSLEYLKNSSCLRKTILVRYFLSFATFYIPLAGSNPVLQVKTCIVTSDRIRNNFSPSDQKRTFCSDAYFIFPIYKLRLSFLLGFRDFFYNRQHAVGID